MERTDAKRERYDGTLKNVLAESENFLIGHSYEYAYLVDKRTHKIMCLGDFYGDPDCALIGNNEEWCLVGGEHLLLYKGTSITTFKEINWIHSMRCAGDYLAMLLTDPWGNDPAVWELNIESVSLRKMRAFPDYQDMPYTDAVIW